MVLWRGRALRCRTWFADGLCHGSLAASCFARSLLFAACCIPGSVMARQTRNSRDTFLPSTSSTPSVGLAPGASSTASAEFIATVVQAVQAAMASPPASLSAAVPTTTATASTIGGLDSQAAQFSAAGAPTAGHALASSQGRSPIVVPSFVTTFAPPSVSLATSSLHVANAPVLPSSAPPLASFNMATDDPLPAPIPLQPFVVGPGFSPVPVKLVSQIVAGKFVDLADLLADNLASHEPEPQLMFDGRLVFTPTSKRQRRHVEDILSWTEAFSIYSLVLTSHFPNRWRDLMAYKLLILRTYRQFNGHVWLSYDQAFREHAAATRLTDWSGMNVQLFNFHAAGAGVRPSSSAARPPTASEATGSPTSQTLCKSWNKGRCVARNQTCKFAHRCIKCQGGHRAQDCSWGRAATSHQRPRSSSPESFKRQKR